jgi:hypothetical protein
MLFEVIRFGVLSNRRKQLVVPLLRHVFIRRKQLVAPLLRRKQLVASN